MARTEIVNNIKHYTCKEYKFKEFWKAFIFYKCISLYKSRFTQNKETVIFISKGDIANIPDQYKNGILWKMGLYFFSRSTNMSSLKSGHMGYM